MASIESIKQLLLSRKAELFERYHIRNLAIFGSYARNEQRPESDIDILVEFNAPIGIEFIDLAERLETLLETRVDLVSRAAIKPRYYERISGDLIYV